jgi:hypothetical protein
VVVHQHEKGENDVNDYNRERSAIFFPKNQQLSQKIDYEQSGHHTDTVPSAHLHTEIDSRIGFLAGLKAAQKPILESTSV